MRSIAAAIATLWLVTGQPAKADLQSDVERILAEEGLVGISWVLLTGSSDVQVGVAGVRDSESRASFTTATRFHVGSLTKSLLATGVLRLATEGRIDLDAPANRYLPGLFFDNPWAKSSAVTVRHLLDHTSGLSDAHLWQVFSERAAPDAPLIAAFPEPKRNLQIRVQPGSRFSYSNMGYTLLGLIIESVTDERYEAYLDANVLVPLSMHDSTFAFTTQEGENADPTLAWGHVDGGLRYAASPVFLRPAGQFTTTMADLGRYANFLLSDGMVGGRAFIDAALMRSRGIPGGTEAANAGLVAGYALGMGRRDRHGAVGYCHGGNIVGFVAMLCIYPDERKAFAYSVNTDSETADYVRLESLFVDALELAELPAPGTAHPATDITDWHGWYTPNPNRFLMFEYLDTVFGAVEIYADRDALMLTSMQTDDRRLRPVGDRLYSAEDRATESHVFYRNEYGEYLFSDGFQTFQKVPMAFLIAHWTSICLGLAGIAWILIAGGVSLFRQRFRMIRHPIAPAFAASLSLFVPVPFFTTQSFMAMGDFTLASALLAAATLLLPIGMLGTILIAGKEWRVSRIYLLHGIAAMLVLQWCVVLIANGMLPFRLWA